VKDLPHHIEDTPPVPSRRTFLAWGLWSAVGIIALSTAWPVIEIAARKLGRKRLVYFNTVSVHDMPEVGVKKAELTIRGGDKPDTRVFIRRDEAGKLIAFSAVCTHLGCIVGFNRVRREFICPCHAGRYDLDGNVVYGPPPRPLERLPVRVQGEYIQVGFRV
jgi:cytochrome b6-f complex iron-sulfur subunit